MEYRMNLLVLCVRGGHSFEQVACVWVWVCVCVWVGNMWGTALYNSLIITLTTL